MSFKSRFVSLEQRVESKFISFFTKGGLKSAFKSAATRATAFEQAHHLAVMPGTIQASQNMVNKMNATKPTFAPTPTPTM